MQPKISVIICCYNSATRIGRTLRYLSEQKFAEKSEWEILIVDNNSNDNTAETAIAAWKQFNSSVPLRIVNEKEQGLSNARKRGVESANGELIIFCDDDNWLCETYIQTACDIMDGNAAIGILAGQGIAMADVPIPNWLYSYYGRYACGVIAITSRDVTHLHWVWGAGMVLRRKVLLSLYEVGFRNFSSDRKGSDMSSGGDVEIGYWHYLTGHRLWYDEELVFYHYMPESRLTKENAIKQFAAQKVSYNEVLSVYKQFVKLLNRELSVSEKIKSKLWAVYALLGGKVSNGLLLKYKLHSFLDKNSIEHNLLAAMEKFKTN